MELGNKQRVFLELLIRKERKEMLNIGKSIVKFRIPILIISLALLIPSAIGYFNTRVNYDILSYLPKDIETMKGQDILLNDFGTGAFSLVVVENMDPKDISNMRQEIANIPHVKDAIWYDSIMDLSIPMELLPSDIYEFFNNKSQDSTLVAVLYDTSMSADETMKAIGDMRKVVSKDCFVSGMAAVVTDTKNLSDRETPIYVILAVILAVVVLSLTMDSFIIPIFFLLNIGFSVVYNMGSNIFFGQISYITQALAAVLQLGVTMDYSIFLWHSYQDEQKNYSGDNKLAMAHAIANAITSVVGSSVTTIAGFIALCFMSFTLGLDLGVVMAKGVALGVISCVTILPSMILLFNGIIEKTKHKPIIPDLGKIAPFIVKFRFVILILFLLIVGPAYYGQSHTEVYYDLAGTLPESLDSIAANKKLDENFNMGATHMILASSDLTAKDAKDMISEIKTLDGVKTAVGVDSILGPAFPKEFLAADILDNLVSDKYQLILVSSEYKVASDEVNAQCGQIKDVISKYDDKAMLIGEASCTKDLIEITNTDFNTVNAVSIGVIFVIIMFVFKSISIPIVLVSTIEFAIFVNMGIPYYTHTTLPFVASIVIGTIQLGSTVDYAILMTNKYKVNRAAGMDKKGAVTDALAGSVQSIIVSALSFFASTFGVGLYSKIDMISALCSLMARGALISMVVVLTVLPTFFMVFDKIIIHTSMGFKPKNREVKLTYSQDSSLETQHL